ncbi:hypothetical protein EDD36DRAFT_29741 [Exophiala viscosa]|uniref:DUF218 domain-containing protein n=1 Tax=Exophiala viscosa TaxID=2486360 RepID=A0AAN6IKA6_9EURO|nr:hypothetical protein EDD36DRAFT_29741 [Exophiala viscosa]
MAPSVSEPTVRDINTVSKFLSCSAIPSLQTCQPVDVLVFCGNSVIPIANNFFSALEARPDLAQTVVICGGIGHSTQLLYQAVRQNQKYASLADKVDGLSEAEVLHLMLEHFYPKVVEHIQSGTFKLLVERDSTNCGANAIETRRILEDHAIPTPKSMVVVQDPTMSLRTLASFKKAYEHVIPTPTFLGCPTLVPVMSLEGGLHFDLPDYRESDLWDHQRFFDLIMGEIPRLRDDEHGYGPKGKGFIAHVDIPDDVEYAWTRLRDVLESTR